MESGLIRNVTRPLDQAGISYELYTDVVADPTVEKVISGITAVLKADPECIIAVGGGSAMDLAKSIRKIAGQMQPDFKPCLIAIPTTSGTGSEATNFAVITDKSTHIKYPIVDDSLLPAWPRLLDAVVRFAPADCLLLAEGRMRRDLLDGQGELEFRPLPDDSPLRLCDAEGNAVSLLQARAPLWRILGRPLAPRCCPGWQEERTVVLRGDD